MASKKRKLKPKVRSFQFIGGKSEKFWEIVCDGTEVITWWGRIGTEGQELSKRFRFETQAQAYISKKIAEKLDKGYTEVTPSRDKAVPKGKPKKRPLPETKAQREDFMARLRRKVSERPWEN